ncbi:hypothetical protein F5X96DRAFT_640844 [Biscogniauxia mediterranea]|nr:hypothetical protein F5X96DRAFT_640844 [Biscogniauxia mediterranea]
MASKYSNQRVAGKEHIPLYPKGFIAVRILQLIIAIVCLGLCAFGVTYFVFAGDALMLFTAVATLITSIYCLVAHYGPPKLFNYWAILGLDIFLVIFWLISFAILAAQVASIFVYYDDYDSYYDYYGYGGYSSGVLIYAACLAAAAGLGGLQFVLYIVSLSIHGVMLHRHRKAGLKAMPGSSPSTGAPGAAAVSVGGEKFQMQPQNPQTYPAPGSSPLHEQQMYAPPPQQQQQQQQQQQNYYPQQQAPSPLSAQPTGTSSYAPPANQGYPLYEAPGQTQLHHNQ